MTTVSNKPWWTPELFLRKKNNLIARAAIMRRIRDYFDGMGYIEVETPALQTAPCMEPHIQAFRTTLISADRSTSREMYLHTSPEFAMKKLLVAGMEKIYTLPHVFRNCEGSSQHTPEFTMIEWYHVGVDYKRLMDETIGMVRAACDGVVMSRNGIPCDASMEWEILTVCAAVKKYGDIDLEAVLGDFDGFAREMTRVGLPPHAGDTWDDLFFRVMGEKVEPQLGIGRPAIIHDYPAHMAALSRISPVDPRFAERFEVYVCGVELANAFGELTDAAVQRERFYADVALRKSVYGDDYPVDEDFLAAIAHGLPMCSGIALGIDRLVMLICGADKITDVQACEI